MTYDQFKRSRSKKITAEFRGTVEHYLQFWKGYVDSDEIYIDIDAGDIYSHLDD